MSYGDVMAGAYCHMPIGAYCEMPTDRVPTHNSGTGHVATAAAIFHPAAVSDGLWVAFALAVLVLAVIAVKGLLGWFAHRR